MLTACLNSLALQLARQDPGHRLRWVAGRVFSGAKMGNLQNPSPHVLLTQHRPEMSVPASREQRGTEQPCLTASPPVRLHLPVCPWDPLPAGRQRAELGPAKDICIRELHSTPSHQPSGSPGRKMGILKIRAGREKGRAGERQEQQEGGHTCWLEWVCAALRGERWTYLSWELRNY